MKQITKKQGGFTLIEVVLVLAIGALIILMALLAFGGASRSRRDTARTSLAGEIQAAAEQSASNNNGTYPDSTTFAQLKASNAWKDPSSGANGVVYGSSAPTTPGVTFVIGGTCNVDGKALGTVTASNTSQYAVIYYQETSKATVCKSN